MTVDEQAGLLLSPLQSGPSGHRSDLLVAADSPWFAGHFPGHPVLPAIAQLVLAIRLHQAAGGRGHLAGIEGMRFGDLVRPGDRLVARLAIADDSGRSHFRLERGDGGEISSGSLVWGSPSADQVSDPPEDDAGGEPLPAVLPHVGASRLLDRFVVRGPGRAEATGRIPANHAAARDRMVPALVAVELAAQAAAQVPIPRDPAASEGAPGTGDDREAPFGYLVRLRDIHFARVELPVEAPLIAHLDLAGRTGPLTRFDFVVVLPTGEPLAAGALTTWEVAKPD